jgi:thioredoxin-dependent peroxiredoxin
MMSEVYFKGEPVQLQGNFPKVGDTAPPFELLEKNMGKKSLSDFSGVKLLNIFPSIDTPICAQSVKTFYEKCKSITVLNISMDLPFALNRYCSTENMENVITLSSFRTTFADDYGVLMLDGPIAGLCARAALLLDESNKVVYAELAPEITTSLDFDKLLAFIK